MTQRAVIIGGPKVGKTTYSRTMPGPVRHTDDIIGSFGDDGWSKESEAVAGWFDLPGPWTVEGVTTARALRKWLAAHPTGKPCDVVVWLDRPDVEPTKGQDAMAKSVRTVFAEILPELERRGVRVVDPEWTTQGWGGWPVEATR